MLDRAAVLDWVHRDWAALARIKEQAWLDYKRRYGPAGGILMGDELRRLALLLHPDWPTKRQRRADRAAHLRVIDAIRRVSLRQERPRSGSGARDAKAAARPARKKRAPPKGR